MYWGLAESGRCSGARRGIGGIRGHLGVPWGVGAIMGASEV